MEIRHEDLVQAIVWYASSRGEKLTTLRLVKFLYLADLYHARNSKGQTLTGWPWAFVYFGPWCKEVNAAIEATAKNGLIVAQEYPSKYDDEKDYRLFWIEDAEDEPKILDDLPIYVSSKLKWAIQKWSDDSSGLLDYVYFETEPMIETRPGALLDFSQARMPEAPTKVEIKKLPKERVEEAKKAVARLREKYKNGITSRPPQGPIDTAFHEFISKLEEEDLETGLEGTAEFGDLSSGKKP